MSDQQQVAKNPLQGYFRQPKIYVRLPSQGKYYPEGSLDRSENGEYPVFAMTAKDELMLKTPDALMNGQATTEVIKSCVPAILDPWKMPSIDVDAILVAIRVATYGEEMELASGCPSCNTVNDYVMNLTDYINGVANFNYKDTINIGPLTVHIRPYDYRETTKTAMKAIEQEKIFNLVNDNSISDDEKVARFGESFIRLTELTVDIISNTVASIDTPEGTVTDRNHIDEFIKNAPKDVFEAINNHITELRKHVEIQPQEVECTECQTKYTIAVTMDQANFFAVRS